MITEPAADVEQRRTMMAGVPSRAGYRHSVANGECATSTARTSWVLISGACVRDPDGRATRLAVPSRTSTRASKRKRRCNVLNSAMPWRWRRAPRRALGLDRRDRRVPFLSPDARDLRIPAGHALCRPADFLARFPFHPEDRAKWQKAASEHFAGASKRFDTEIRMIRHGETRWIHFSGLLSRDADDRPVRWTGSVSDVTDRKASEAALRESEERFALAVAGSNDGIWDLDCLSGQMFMSDRAQELHGLEVGPSSRSRSEWREAIRFHPEDGERRDELTEGYLDGRVPSYDGEYRVAHQDGTFDGCESGFLARNSLLHLSEPDDFAALFAAVRRHLAPGGIFAFDIFNPDLRLLARPAGQRSPVMRVELLLWRALVEATVDYDRRSQVDRATWFISTTAHRDRWVAPLHLRSIFPQELLMLLESNGFRLAESRRRLCGRQIIKCERHPGVSVRARSID